MKILELFGGIGAPRKALENLGHVVQSDYVEIDKHATASYNAMYNEQHEPTSVTDFNKKGEEYDLIFHGSPCQDFSIAGKGAGGERGSGTRSSLMWETVRIIGETNAKNVVWENVKNVTSGKHIKNLTNYIDALAILGYKTSFEVLKATDFGVPQARERIFVVSTLDEVFDFDSLERLKVRKLENYIDFTTLEAAELHIKQATKKGYIELETPGVANISFPESETRRGRVIERGKVVGTLQTSNNYGVFEKGKPVRDLTALEAWRLMGFDDEDYHAAAEVNSNTQLYKQAGNSIVVPVLEAIFKELFKENDEQ